MKRAHATTGFTMVELMIGIAIVSLLMAIGLPAFSTWMNNTKIRTVAESMLHGLQLARSEAVSRNSIVEFTLTGGTGWRVGCPTVTANCPETIQRRSAGEGNAAAVTAVASDGTPIGFDNLGLLAYPTPSGGASDVRIEVDIDPAVLPASESKNLRIAVATGGGIRMCDPNVTNAADARAC